MLVAFTLGNFSSTVSIRNENELPIHLSLLELNVNEFALVLGMHVTHHNGFIIIASLPLAVGEHLYFFPEGHGPEKATIPSAAGRRRNK